LKNALIVFLKSPEKGKVKTRIAKTEGEERALEIYRLLLDKTYCLAEKIASKQVVVFVFYAGNPSELERWMKFSFYSQEGKDLGERMLNAFKTVFEQGYQNIGIIGSDCYSLTDKQIQLGFEIVEKYDFVFGPAIDGGYYALFMKTRTNFIFENMTWSHPNVLADSIRKIESMEQTYYLLEKLRDVDTVDDWITLKANTNEESV
jgi:rSAM/selenodomain-associated transferase 1